MEVAVEPASGRIDVRRVVCAHDCGLVVNPEALRNQIEGAIVQGLSRAMHEEVQFDRSRVTSVDLGKLSNPEVLRGALHRRHPDQQARPAAVGCRRGRDGPLAAALGNAFFDATGMRLRRGPLTPARVKEAFSRGAV
jgi:CO/xanthine dehydrogenase Mo-binding subunit